MTRETMAAMLDEIKHLATHASLTHSFKGGARPMAEVYNRCLEALKAAGDTEVGEIFHPLSPDTTGIDEVGTYAALLARYVQPQSPARKVVDDDED